MSAKFTTSLILNDCHQDLIHHVEFDYYGRRIATSSSDMMVCVWDLSPSGTWIKSATWKSHGGPVWKVIWAHPEFGQILATCSFDRSVIIWEETVKSAESRSSVQPDPKRTVKFWKRCCQLVDSRHNVTDIKFAPRHLGLMIGTVSSQGILRVYEAPDIMNLSMWNLNHDIAAFKYRCSALTWSSNRLAKSLIVVSSDDTKNCGSKVMIYEYQYSSRKWQALESSSICVNGPVTDVSFAPSAGRSYHLLAVASKDIQLYKLNGPNRKNLLTEDELDYEEPTDYEISLVGSLESNGEDEVSKSIIDASDNCGQPSEYNISLVSGLQNTSNPTIQVWRISWNITGTVLVAGSSDGIIRVWKAFLNTWNLVATIKLDEDSKGVEDDDGNVTATLNIISKDNHVYY